MVWGGRRDSGSSRGPAPDQPDSWGLLVGSRPLLTRPAKVFNGTVGGADETPFPSNVSCTPRVVRGLRVFCMRSSQEILVSLLMLCKLPISSLEFFSKKRARKKRSLRNMITQPVDPAGSLLSGILPFSRTRPPGPSHPPLPRYLHPSSCAHSQRSGASNTHRVPASLSCVQSLCCLFTVLVNL